MQYDQMGPVAYFWAVGVPSVAIYTLNELNMLPYEYHSFAWEAEANELSGATFDFDKPPVPQRFNDAYDVYKTVVMILFPKERRIYNPFAVDLIVVPRWSEI